MGRAVFPPWNEGPNFGSYTVKKRVGVYIENIYIRRDIVLRGSVFPQDYFD